MRLIIEVMEFVDRLRFIDRACVIGADFLDPGDIRVENIPFVAAQRLAVSGASDETVTIAVLCASAGSASQELAAAGFDAEALLAATQDPQVKAKLAQNTEAAVERGAFGIPTFYVDGEMWFGKERLGQIEDYLGGGKP